MTDCTLLTLFKDKTIRCPIKEIIVQRETRTNVSNFGLPHIVKRLTYFHIHLDMNECSSVRKLSEEVYKKQELPVLIIQGEEGNHLNLNLCSVLTTENIVTLVAHSLRV